MAKRIFLVVLIFLTIYQVILPRRGVHAQGSPEDQARALLTRLTPEERIGQLFLVSFYGTDISSNSFIYDLIVRYHVGGLILKADNDNFSPAPDTLTKTFQLVSGLQEIEWSNSLQNNSAGASTDLATPNTYVPLLVGIYQPGDGLPYDQIINGLSPVAPEMAVGATWDPTVALQTGEILGSELSALGINLYLGPSLDVLTSPSSKAGDPGTLVFGGDPYWVGKLGQSYIAGLHSGSDNRVAVISSNFPGRGEADRSPDEEVSTVRKSLEQLKQIELAPFFAVTGNAPTTDMTTDGLLVSHIRYQGLQGNIRATTRPVSFDSQALEQILSLDQFSAWRQSGGVLVSDDLGSRAVSRFYDPSGNNFSGLIVTRDAFLAGNDLLYVGNIRSTGDENSYDTVRKILDFFTQKYREDSTFAQRVDDSVLRILTLKFRLYDSFTLSNVVPDSGFESIGSSLPVSENIARKAATLISPSLSEMGNILPNPPAIRDRLVFITDNHAGQQCSKCLLQPYMAADALMSTVVRLYGLQGANQISSSRLTSYTMDDLAGMLSGTQTDPEMENNIRLADWLVFSTLELKESDPHTDILSRFLSERADLLRDKRVVLFSFGAPYYLDATDISKLTAFYSLYGKSQPFIDSAARLLFQEINPTGRLPVSVSSVDYNLISATSPDASQVIQLYLDLPPAPTPEAGITPEPTPIPLFTQGSTISVRTGVVVDSIGNPVPDDTVVTFTEKVEGGTFQQLESETADGVASASFRLDKPGLVEISASSEPAITSVVLQVDVSPGQSVAVTVIAPTEVIEPADTPLPMPTPTPGALGTDSFTLDGFPLFSSWLLAIVILAVSGGITYLSFSQFRSIQWSVRWTACMILGGLAAFNYAALGLPGSQSWIQENGFSGILFMLAVGMGIGLLFAWIWERANKKTQQK